MTNSDMRGGFPPVPRALDPGGVDPDSAARAPNPDPAVMFSYGGNLGGVSHHRERERRLSFPGVEPSTPAGFTRAIIAAAAAEYSVTVDDILGPRRFGRFLKARHAAMRAVKLARPEMSYPTMGRIFNRDHTTVMNALGALKKKAR